MAPGTRGWRASSPVAVRNRSPALVQARASCSLRNAHEIILRWAARIGARETAVIRCHRTSLCGLTLPVIPDRMVIIFRGKNEYLSMIRVCLLILVCVLSAAGCVTEHTDPVRHPDLLLITPAEPFPLFVDQGQYRAILEGENLSVPARYSLGLVTIPPGKATPPHRLLGTTELIAVLAGEAAVRCDNETVIAPPGSVVLLPADVLQSIAARGNDDLVYLTVIQPPYTAGIDIREGDPALYTIVSDHVPVLVTSPGEGIIWDYETGTRITTLLNPVLMPELDLPVSYSIAYAELLPGGYIAENQLIGSSELIYVVTGEIGIITPRGTVITVPAGSAGYIPPDQVKRYWNTGSTVSTMLTIVDPAWTPEMTVMAGS